MRNLVIAVAPTLLSVLASAQESDPEVLKERLATELAKPFIEYGGWVTDYDAAREQANKQGKVLFAYFTRSYAH